MRGKHIIRFIILIFLQVVVLNHINLGGYVNPYLYVFFILALPFQVQNWLLLVSAFMIGFGVDLFSNTPGLNAAASVVMAFARPFVIRIISSTVDFEPGSEPTLQSQGLRWYLYYTVILVVLHHSVLFYLEVFRFSEFFPTLLRVILSSAFTLGLIFLTEYLIVRKK